MPLKHTYSQQIIELVEQKCTMVTYLQMKMKQEDWHGVADAAMDIREIEAKLTIYNNINE